MHLTCRDRPSDSMAGPAKGIQPLLADILERIARKS